ncbi:MAG: hypothetical protein J6U17_03210 [Kiritimatiellae bacterium]|nr:hypothetical protein [Kiritimatiellia bacterium]
MKLKKTEIEEFKSQISDYNDRCEAKAQEKFAKGPVPKMEWMINHLLEAILERIAAVRSGTAPDELGSYLADELARVLATKTYCEYEGLSLDEELVAKADCAVSYKEVASECTVLAWTPTFGLWRRLLAALGEYLREAAVFAKSVNASSTAARMFLRAMRLVGRIDARSRDYGEAWESEAIAIVRLERVASERLWVDAQFAALPPFRKQEPVPEKGAAKGKRSGKSN